MIHRRSLNKLILALLLWTGAPTLAHGESCRDALAGSASLSAFARLNGVGAATVAGRRLGNRMLGSAGRRLFKSSGPRFGGAAARRAAADEVQTPTPTGRVDPRDLEARNNTDGVAPGVYRSLQRQSRLRQLLREIDPDENFIQRRILPSGRVQYFVRRGDQRVVFAPYVLELYADLVIGSRQETLLLPVRENDSVRSEAADFILNEAWRALRSPPGIARDLDGLSVVLGSRYLRRLYSDIIEQLWRHHESGLPAGHLMGMSYAPSRAQTEMTISAPINIWNLFNVETPLGRYDRNLLSEPAFVDHVQRWLRGEEVTPDPELLYQIADYEIRHNRHSAHVKRVKRAANLTQQQLEMAFPNFFMAMRDLAMTARKSQRRLLRQRHRLVWSLR